MRWHDIYMTLCDECDICSNIYDHLQLAVAYPDDLYQAVKTRLLSSKLCSSYRPIMQVSQYVTAVMTHLLVSEIIR